MKNEQDVRAFLRQRTAARRDTSAWDPQTVTTAARGMASTPDDEWEQRMHEMGMSGTQIRQVTAQRDSIGRPAPRPSRTPATPAPAPPAPSGGNDLRTEADVRTFMQSRSMAKQLGGGPTPFEPEPPAPQKKGSRVLAGAKGGLSLGHAPGSAMPEGADSVGDKILYGAGYLAGSMPAAALTGFGTTHLLGRAAPHLAGKLPGIAKAMQYLSKAPTKAASAGRVAARDALRGGATREVAGAAGKQAGRGAIKQAAAQNVAQGLGFSASTEPIRKLEEGDTRAASIARNTAFGTAADVALGGLLGRFGGAAARAATGPAPRSSVGPRSMLPRADGPVHGPQPQSQPWPARATEPGVRGLHPAHEVLPPPEPRAPRPRGVERGEGELPGAIDIAIRRMNENAAPARQAEDAARVIEDAATRSRAIESGLTVDPASSPRILDPQGRPARAEPDVPGELVLPPPAPRARPLQPNVGLESPAPRAPERPVDTSAGSAVDIAMRSGRGDELPTALEAGQRRAGEIAREIHPPVVHPEGELPGQIARTGQRPTPAEVIADDMATRSRYAGLLPDAPPSSPLLVDPQGRPLRSGGPLDEALPAPEPRARSEPVRPELAAEPAVAAAPEPAAPVRTEPAPAPAAAPLADEFAGEIAKVPKAKRDAMAALLESESDADLFKNASNLMALRLSTEESDLATRIISAARQRFMAGADEATQAAAGEQRRRVADMMDPSREAELQQAYTDPLTNLANDTAWKRARDRISADPDTEIAFIDAINLKGFNERLSDEAGDAYLAEVGRVIREVADEMGIPQRDLFRAGGDEFAIVAPRRGRTALVAVREVQRRLGNPPIGDSGLSGGVRFGMGDTWKEASAAMHVAKKAETGPRHRGGEATAGKADAPAAAPAESRPAAAEPPGRADAPETVRTEPEPAAPERASLEEPEAPKKEPTAAPAVRLASVEDVNKGIVARVDDNTTATRLADAIESETGITIEFDIDNGTYTLRTAPGAKSDVESLGPTHRAWAIARNEVRRMEREAAGAQAGTVRAEPAAVPDAPTARADTPEPEPVPAPARTDSPELQAARDEVATWESARDSDPDWTARDEQLLQEARGRLEALERGDAPAARAAEPGQPAAVEPVKPKERAPDTIEPDPTVVPAVQGKETRIRFGDGVEVKARYRASEAADLQPSHNAETFQQNPRYPEGVQPREYHRDQNLQEAVVQVQREMDPDIVLSDFPGATEGPPISTPDRRTLSGNSRLMAMQRVYNEGGEAADRLRRAQIEAGERFGLDRAELEAMSQPIIDREIIDPTFDPTSRKALSELAQIANNPTTKADSPWADASTRGARLRRSSQSLQHLEDTYDPEQTLRAYLSESDGKKFTDELIRDGVIARSELSKYVDSQGLLNSDGRDLVERALVAAMVDDPGLLSRLDDSLRGVRNNITPGAPAMLRAASVEGWDLSGSLTEALEAMLEAKGKGLTVRGLLDQVSLLEEAKRSGHAGTIARFLDEAKPGEVKEAFRKYAREAEIARMQGQSDDLFGAKPRQPGEVIEEAFGLTDRMKDSKRKPCQ